MLAQRYALSGLLGSGGFGDTYLAFDQKFSRRTCVVKRQRIGPAWDAAERARHIERFAREANLLAGLNTPGHPSIPEIFDFLPEDRCLVMKYIVGHDLKAVLAERNRPLDLQSALRYTRDICSALVYLHGRTPPILHRDVKPANILLDATDRVWLVDFGLAVPDSAVSGGTLGYAPPEQWAGRAEPRSDIFALGVTLYQLLTGVRQFNTETAQAISRGATSALPPVEQLNPAVDQAVAELIARCIAPDLARRPDALTLLTDLDRLVSRPIIPETFKPDPLPNTPMFIGRDRELTQLEQRLAREGLVAITGLAGVGKTALAASLAWRSGEQSRIFWHRLIPGQGAERLLRTLSAFIAYHGDSMLLRLLAQRTKDVPLESVFHGAAAETGPGHLTFEHCCDYLVDALRGHNYVLALDDAHIDGEDSRTRALCERLADLARSGEISMIITARSAPPWLGHQDCSPLSGLGHADTRALLLARDLALDQQTLERIVALTGGHAELLHLIANRLRGASNAVRALEELSRGGDIHQYLVEQVYEQLAPEEQRVIDAVAILGDEGATRDAIEFVVEMEDCGATIRDLTLRYLLESAGSSLGSMQYTLHASLGPVCLGQLGGRRARILHRRAAAYFSQEASQPLRAAEHFFAAGQVADAAALAITHLPEIVNAGQGRALAELLERLDPSKLEVALWSRLYTARGELAALHGSFTTARRWVEQAIGAEQGVEGGDPTRSVTLAYRRRLLAFFSQRLGEYQQAEQICRAALAELVELPPAHPEHARLHIELATALWRQGRFAEALAACADGLRAAPIGPTGDHERLLLWYIEAAIAIDQGHYDHALEQLAHSLALADSMGDKTLQAHLYQKFGLANYRKGNTGAARAAYEQSLGLRRALGDPVGEIAALNDLATVDWAGGAWQAARQSFETCVERCRRLGLRAHEASARQNLGQMLLEYGQSLEAAEQLEQALAAYRHIGAEIKQAHCHYLLGDIALLHGDPQGAYSAGLAALQHAPVEKSPAYASCALRVMGAARLAQGRPIEADAYLAQAWRAQGEVEDAYDQAWILAGWAEVALALDEYHRAVARARQALALAEEQRIAPLIERMGALLAIEAPGSTSA